MSEQAFGIKVIELSCPSCGSVDIEDESVYSHDRNLKKNNIKEKYSCNQCGIIFKNVKKMQKNEG